ncbi:MAG: hypothetical protein ACPG8W_13450, partial [Candidatus Promineifilaceae bacterium]
ATKHLSFDTIWFWLVIGLSVLLLALGGVGLSSADKTATGYDPLSSAEIDAITNGALIDTRTTAQMEVLLVERHSESKQTEQRGTWRRRADVYLYDYATNQLTVALVDVESGVVESIEQARMVQLPLTEAEIARAIEIVEADEAVWAAVSAELSRATDTELPSLAAVQIKAFTFVATSLPHRANAASQACGLQRCAQLLLYTTDDIALDLMPIVNLSTHETTQVMGLVSDAPHFHFGGDQHEH